MSTILGKPITMGGGGKLPDIFGDGSDGDLVIKAGETVTLPVPVPHQSVIEMQYKSITIEAGGTLTTADYNAGLVLRCQGDCNIAGIIDQSGKGPKTNPNNSYPYPEELICGDGGDGGANTTLASSGVTVSGGVGMPGRPYGGGISGGGAGMFGNYQSTSRPPGKGGDADGITIDTADNQMFVGGARASYGTSGRPGSNAGGGSGVGAAMQEDDAYGGAGGTNPGGAGEAGQVSGRARGGRGGGAGNYGGGVVLLYVGGNFFLEGTVDCSGLNGGSPNGGGGGGGSIYVVHNGTQTVTGNLLVSGGASGGGNGEAGGVGTTTVKEYERGMTA